MKTIILALAACFVASYSTPAFAALSVNAASVDTAATASSGMLGSSATDTVDPPELSGVAANLSSSATAVAGPVAPGSSPSLPGTTGVSTATANSVVDLTNASVSIPFSLQALVSFASTDGGITGANADGFFEVEFTVPSDTDYAVSGTFDIDDEDQAWRLQLEGPGGFLINATTVSQLSGAVAETGTLVANTLYTLSGQVGVSETDTLDGVNFSESSVINATFTVVPEPSSLTVMLGVLVGALLPRRS